MSMALEKWQERLERHFAALAATRSGSGFPLFAIEHGLEKSDFDVITKLLHSRVAAGLRLSTHWLVWVVYATEIGYDYDGEEYWYTFEERTPHWRENASRSQLRVWFSKFHATYHGVNPSGPWAEWFSIISWPITHAILPKYLQFQFAKILYGLRYQLAGLDALSPAAIGRMLSTHAWDASTRFRVFLEQEELAGRLVLALISDRTVEGESPIYPPTLQRLVLDLERVRSAREWLKETRRVVADRFKGAGSGHSLLSRQDDGGQGGYGTSAATVPRIKPTFVLRRTSSDVWSVVIDIPSFASIARLNAELMTFLKNTRCKIAGATDTWLPSGWLISSPQKRVLKNWPGAGTTLIRFEQSNGKLDHILQSEAQLSSGPIWLFRIGPDGLAREVMGRIIRPGFSYVLVTEGTLHFSNHLLSPSIVDCAGISAAILSVPLNISSEDINLLQQNGLQLIRTIRIWPAGLIARGWDGEGYTEWLTTEAPCFGISHDHLVDNYCLRLNSGPEVIIESGLVGQPSFVSLPPLPVGRHLLSVKANRKNISVMPATEGIITLNVREPDYWIPGMASCAGLVVTLDPHESNLDTFWGGNVDVSIIGPEGHQVLCSISLMNASGKELLSEQIASFDLPVTAEVWLRKFKKFVEDERRAWTYVEAASGRFVVRCGELGEYVLRLERDVIPIRLVCRNVHHNTVIRLIDDTGRDQIPTVSKFFGFARPCHALSIDAQAITTGIEVESPGGLIIAQHQDIMDAVIVSTPQIKGGFKGLVVDPDLKDLDDCSTNIKQLLYMLKLWNEARLAGPLVAIRRDRILQGLLSRLFSKLYGNKWAEAEIALLSNPHSITALQQLQRLVGGVSGFSAILAHSYEKMEAGTDQGGKWFVDIASRCYVCSEDSLCLFALKLASQPHYLYSELGESLDALLHKVSDKNVLLRGARLLGLLSFIKSSDGVGIPLPRWLW